MAESDAVAHGAKSAGNVLTKKIGPLPGFVWVGAAGVIYLYFSKKQKAASAATMAGANQQTDPAGNVGSIDPSTGYVYGTPEDQAALSSQDASTGTSSSSTSGSTTAGQYTDNNAWAEAAINYLVARGVDPVEANAAIEQYITSQTLTAQQQADVNLAIQGIGAPPTPPNPGTSGGGIVSPPSPGPVYASNPPTGVAATNITSNSVVLNWNKVTNATGYTVTWSGGSTTVSGTNTTTTITGLSPATSYNFTVQATPAKPGDPSGTVQATTSKGTIQGGNPPSGGGPTPVGTKTTTVTVVKWTPTNTPWNSTLSGIANHYHTTVNAILKLNPKITNANLIYPGQQIIVPTS